MHIVRDDGKLIVSVLGALDLVSVPIIREQILVAVAAYDGPVVIDLVGVRYLDTSGMGLLMQLYSRTHERPILRTAAGSQPERIMRLAHWDDLFSLSPVSSPHRSGDRAASRRMS